MFSHFNLKNNFLLQPADHLLQTEIWHKNKFKLTPGQSLPDEKLRKVDFHPSLTAFNSSHFVIAGFHALNPNVAMVFWPSQKWTNLPPLPVWQFELYPYICKLAVLHGKNYEKTIYAACTATNDLQFYQSCHFIIFEYDMHENNWLIVYNEFKSWDMVGMNLSYCYAYRGFLYVLMMNGKIYKFDPATRELNDFAYLLGHEILNAIPYYA